MKADDSVLREQLAQSNDQLDLERDQNRASENEYKEIAAQKEAQIKDLNKDLIEKQTHTCSLIKSTTTAAKEIEGLTAQIS